MNTVQKNNNITKAELQGFVEKNYKEIGLSEKNKEKLKKYINLKKCTKEKRNLLYSQLKKIIQIEKSKKGKHITSKERVIIEILFNAGLPNTVIAMILNKNRSTIGREIQRGKIESEDINCTKSYRKENCFKIIVTYDSRKAEDVHLLNKLKCRKKYKLIKDLKLCDIVTKMIKGIVDEETKVKIKYSPEVISAFLKMKKVKYIDSYISTTAIYNAANSGIFGFSVRDLPHEKKYWKKKNEHAQYKEHTRELKKEHSIEKMPDKIKNKESITHFEGDSVIGKRAGRKNTLITLVNTSSKFLIVERSKNKTSQAFVDVLDKLEKEIPNFNKIMETLLLDNGVEFSDIEGIMTSKKDENKKRIEVYYAHPYTSCERGCNENKNKDIRKDFPKGKLVEDLSDEDILNIARRINNTPRKILGYKTALEVFEEQLIKMNLDINFLEKYRIKKSRMFVA